MLPMKMKRAKATGARRRVAPAVVAALTSCALTVALAMTMTVTTAAAAELAVQPERQVTFAKDIAPILQRSCQRCHRPDSIAPMSLITYEEARPWARAIKQQTGLRQMPPWFIEREIGIQRFRDDPSLSDEEITTIAAWADSGAPRGNPADMPPAVDFPARGHWSIGEPDLIVSSPAVTMEAVTPDWWGAIGDAPTGLTEDRYVAALETLEVSDAPHSAIFHHAGFVVLTADGRFESGATHEVGRNPEIFDPEAGKPMTAGGSVSFNNVHAHANGRPTRAHLEVGFRFHPKEYTPRLVIRGVTIGSPELDVKGNTPDQMVEAFMTLPAAAKLMNFEAHMHAAGSRMCLDAVWGTVRETLTCAGFNPLWVKNYFYDTDSAPLLPKGTILHLTGWMDTTPNPTNPYLTDYRNWTGWGSRPVDNMFMNYLTVAFLTDEQLREEVETRRERVTLGEGELLGCLPCTLPDALPEAAAQAGVQ